MAEERPSMQIQSIHFIFDHKIPPDVKSAKTLTVATALKILVCFSELHQGVMIDKYLKKTRGTTGRWLRDGILMRLVDKWTEELGDNTEPIVEFIETYCSEEAIKYGTFLSLVRNNSVWAEILINMGSDLIGLNDIPMVFKVTNPKTLKLFIKAGESSGIYRTISYCDLSGRYYNPFHRDDPILSLIDYFVKESDIFNTFEDQRESISLLVEAGVKYEDYSEEFTKLRPVERLKGYYWLRPVERLKSYYWLLLEAGSNLRPEDSYYYKALNGYDDPIDFLTKYYDVSKGTILKWFPTPEKRHQKMNQICVEAVNTFEQLQSDFKQKSRERSDRRERREVLEEPSTAYE